MVAKSCMSSSTVEEMRTVRSVSEGEDFLYSVSRVLQRHEVVSTSDRPVTIRTSLPKGFFEVDAGSVLIQRMGTVVLERNLPEYNSRDEYYNSNRSDYVSPGHQAAKRRQTVVGGSGSKEEDDGADVDVAKVNMMKEGPRMMSKEKLWEMSGMRLMMREKRK